MSRTDKDAPYWVRAQRHHEETGHSGVHHSWHCLDYDGYLRPRDWIIKRVDAEVAAANGWPLDPYWGHFSNDARAYVRVPHGPYECDVDSGGGRCHRYIDYGRYGYTRWYGGQDGPGPDRRHLSYYGPERARVRDDLRDVARDFNANGVGSLAVTGGLADADGSGEEGWDPETEVPVRQARNSTWYGGWWD